MRFLQFIITLSLLVSETQSAPYFRAGYTPYVGVIDAGSTGSRFYLYKTDRNENNEITKIVEVYSAECQPGINSYAKNLNNVWEPIYKLVKGSEKFISHSSHDVPLYIFATAGMRVLSKTDQNAIYDAIYEGYKKSDLHFYMTRKMLATIDGEVEGIYGWITVNVLNGNITPSLKYTSRGTIGSLDLGGESTQIAYQQNERSEGSFIDFSKDVFSKSFLSFGAKEAQFRYENYILSNREALRDISDNRQNKLNVPNPCNNEGLVASLSNYEGLSHEGTGSFDKCQSILSHLIQGDTPCHDTETKKCSLWSLPIPLIQSDFIGMSLYFFVVDFVKAVFQLGEGAQPSVEELKEYGRSFCAMRWADVLQNYSGKHRYTNTEALKQRCFQIVYVVTLLESGYRITESKKSQDAEPVSIEFLRNINGESVDWPYGAALFVGRNPVPYRLDWKLVILVSIVLVLVILLFTSNGTAVRYKKLPIV